MDNIDALKDLLKSLPGENSIYFQPPPTIQMTYPALVFELSKLSAIHSNNRPYILREMYLITAIYSDPESSLPKDIAKLPGCAFDRVFIADNRYHAVFTIHF